MLDGLCCDDFYSLCIGSEVVHEFRSYDRDGSPFTVMYGLVGDRVSWVTICPEHRCTLVEFLEFRFQVRYFNGDD